MKKLGILIATALLASSSVALAKPAVVVDPGDDVTVRDHRDPDDRYRHYDNDRDDDRFRDRDDRRFYRIRPGTQPTWMDLGMARTGKTRIAVGEDAGLFRSLKLDIKGWLRVGSVLVRFTDGTEQRFKVARSYDASDAPMVLDLGGNKEIRAIIVQAAAYGRGRVEISGLAPTRYYWRHQASR
jgi:hypothetical protein